MEAILYFFILYLFYLTKKTEFYQICFLKSLTYPKLPTA